MEVCSASCSHHTAIARAVALCDAELGTVVLAKRLGRSSMARIKACKVDRLKPGEAMRLNQTPPIAVYRLEDGFYATDDTCSHAQASLSAGDVDLKECTVECPYHGSLFDVRTGRALSLPANRPVKAYPVTIENDEVFVETE
jgi:nitrite reductase/ring-hydroxylating ferredoxin subunit